MIYSIRPANIDDVGCIIRNIRTVDREEVEASVNMSSPLSYVVNTYMVSRDTSRVGCYDGTPYCIFGVREPALIGDTAVPWLIGTEGLEQHARHFLKHSKEVIAEWKAKYKYMENYVYWRNTLALRWLLWLGFSVYSPKPWGPKNLPFHRFDMRN